MANLNKVMLIGRLTRDPESRSFSNGGKVCNFGFAVTGERKKNPTTGEWEEKPCFLDCAAFNKGDYGKTADLIEQYLKKGDQAFLEGHLVLDQWEDKNTGEKRSKIKVIVDGVQFLNPKSSERANNSENTSRPPAQRRSTAPAQGQSQGRSYGNSEEYPDYDNGTGNNEEEIPF